MPFLAFSGSAKAYTICDAAHGAPCWARPPFGNFSQLALSANQGGLGLGIACGVTSNTPDDWGGSVLCVQANGQYGATLQLVAGEHYGSFYFDSTQASTRIVSIAIETWPSLPNILQIDVLRGDGTLYISAINWPTPQQSSQYQFSYAPGPPPPSPRDIAFVGGVGLIVTDTSNQQWKQLGRDQNYQWQKVADHLVFVAGNEAGQSIALYGTQGTSTHVGRLYGTGSPPDLPSADGTLIYGYSDPNSSFSALGRTKPMGIGPKDAWAVMTKQSCGNAWPCILHSTLGSSGWSSWSGFHTDGLGSDLFALSIQDGFAMRGKTGEIWVIDSNSRLLFWVPN